MPVLSENSVLIMDGAVKLYKRERSRKWQVAFQIDGQYIRISTGKSDLDEAKQAASDSYLEYKFRQKNGVPVVSKRFSDVAKLCITEMNKQLESGVGKKVYRDYVIVLEKYLIPFFGKMYVTSITYETLQKFARWHEQQMGREPKASTLNTHNSALNRVFDESVARGFMNKTQVPTLINKGRDSERRSDFSQEGYASMIRKLPNWINKTQHPKSVHMRELLRHYVLIMANTGMRHGTEAQNLKWQHITQFEDKGQSYLEMSIGGKTGRRDIIISDTVDSLLVAHKDRAQEVRAIVDELKSRNDAIYKEFPTVHRPWGTYMVLQEGVGFKLKRIELKPGARLSLQSHKYRSGHWVVLSGKALVTNGEEQIELQPNQSTYIPLGNKYRLENLGTEQLILIEIQFGSYLGEDDIVRYEDSYGRAE